MSEAIKVIKNIAITAFYATLVLFGSTFASWAQSGSSDLVSSPFSKRLSFYRYLEDYSDITEEDKSGDWFATIKKIPLSKSGAYLSIGGEYRLRYESYDNASFGLRPGPSFGSYQNRTFLHGDFHWNDNLRTFIQLSYFAESGRVPGPRPVDESNADVQQAFFDIGLGNANLRLGRQELVLGSGLYTGVREGPNQRRAFDAAKLSFSLANSTQMTVFYGREVQPRRASFKDSSKHGPKFWGVYASNIGLSQRGAMADVYYLGIDRALGVFESGIGREQRHSIGGRLYGKSGSFSYNYEGVYQFGKFGAQDIGAWALLTSHEYAPPNLPQAPKFILNLNVSSGDSDPNDGRLGTFDAMFPNNSSISESAPVRRRNLIEFNPRVKYALAKNLHVTAGATGLWRTQKSDAIYAAPGFSLASGATLSGRYIGTILEFGATWRMNPHVTIRGTYAHGIASSAVKKAGGEDFDYLMLQSTFKF